MQQGATISQYLLHFLEKTQTIDINFVKKNPYEFSLIRDVVAQHLYLPKLFLSKTLNADFISYHVIHNR